MSTLSWNRYGKSRVRLVKVRRPPSGQSDLPHEIVDLTVDIRLEGAFEAARIKVPRADLRAAINGGATT